jgi:hypothetical protein
LKETPSFGAGHFISMASNGLSLAFLQLPSGLTIIGMVSCTSLLKKQLEHYDNKMFNKDIPEFTEVTKQRMEHGVKNEINAVATIVAKVLPVFFRIVLLTMDTTLPSLLIISSKPSMLDSKSNLFVSKALITKISLLFEIHLARQSNYVHLLDNASTSDLDETDYRFVKQRTDVWFSIRKTAMVTGSTLNVANYGYYFAQFINHL